MTTVVHPTVICCGKSNQGPFSHRDIVLGTSHLIKELAASLGSSATTLECLPDFYTAIEVAPYPNCIKFAAQWTNISGKRAYINVSLQTAHFSGLSQEECLKIARTEAWEAQFSEERNDGQLVFIPEVEELLRHIPGPLYYANTGMQSETLPEDFSNTSIHHQDESTALFKELELVKDRETKELLKIEIYERLLLDLHRELDYSKSQLLVYRREAATLERRQSTLEPRTFPIPDSEKQRTASNILRKLTRIVSTPYLTSQESSDSTRWKTSVSALWHGSSLFPKVQILWAAQLSWQHRKLSTDVIRQICSYAEDVWTPVAVLQSRIHCFDLSQNQWQKRFSYQDQIQVDSSTAYAFIPGNRVFACGGGTEARNAYLIGDGVVSQLMYMRTCRRWPGIIWDATVAAVYVFGGANNDSTDRLCSGEKYLFMTNQWFPLPNMKKTRYGFTPSWHLSRVYLCGGNVPDVEMYDPSANTMTSQNFTLPEGTGCVTVVESGVLKVITENFICELQKGRFSSQEHECYNAWSNCTPVVSQGVVYLVNVEQGSCRGIDLETGASLKDARLW